MNNPFAATRGFIGHNNDHRPPSAPGSTPGPLQQARSFSYSERRRPGEPKPPVTRERGRGESVSRPPAHQTPGKRAPRKPTRTLAHHNGSVPRVASAVPVEARGTRRKTLGRPGRRRRRRHGTTLAYVVISQRYGRRALSRGTPARGRPGLPALFFPVRPCSARLPLCWLGGHLRASSPGTVPAAPCSQVCRPGPYTGTAHASFGALRREPLSPPAARKL